MTNGWMYQGRQQHMWFGHGTKPKDAPAPADIGSLAQRVGAVGNAFVAALPPAQRNHSAARLDAGDHARLARVMSGVVRALPAGTSAIASGILGRHPDAPGIHAFIESGRALNAARTPSDLRLASDRLAQSAREMGLDQFRPFLRSVDQHLKTQTEVKTGRVVKADLGMDGQPADEPPAGTPIYPNGEPYVPLSRVPLNARSILQYRRIWYDQASGTYRVGLQLPRETSVQLMYARRGPDAGRRQTGWLFLPPGSASPSANDTPASAVRVGLHSPVFQGPYFRVYNSEGQPVSPVTGRPGEDRVTHYPLGRALPTGFPLP